MKQKLHKIASVFLTFIVLFSSFSYTVNKHICGDELVDVKLFVAADSCEMTMDSCEYNRDTSDTSIHDEDCCQHISSFIKGNNLIEQAHQSQLIPTQIDFIQSFVATFVLQIEELSSNSNSFSHYKSPLVFNDIQIFFQVFRI